RVHAKSEAGVVAKNNFDGIANLGPDHGAKQAHVRQFRRPGLRRLETVVSVFTEHRFTVFLPDASCPMLDKHLPISVKSFSRHEVHIGWCIIPFRLLSSDIVGPHFARWGGILLGSLRPSTYY